MLANYSLGEGDLLRRAMGKKKPEEMAKQRAAFHGGRAREQASPRPQADEIFDLMEKFAEYGFNKSHSAAYALISYHTAYLKAHFPSEFMAALISSDIDNTDKVFKYINACRDMDIEVVPPDVNLCHARASRVQDEQGPLRPGRASRTWARTPWARSWPSARQNGPFLRHLRPLRAA